MDSRAFFALSVGTSPLDAKVLQNNVLPHREPSLNLGARRTIGLPSVVAAIPAGQSLFLTVTPTSDMCVLHGSRTPSAMVLRDVTAHLPVVRSAAVSARVPTRAGACGCPTARHGCGRRCTGG